MAPAGTMMAAPEMAAAGMRTLCLCRRRRRTGRQAGLGAVPADDARGVVAAHGASARSLGIQLVFGFDCGGTARSSLIPLRSGPAIAIESSILSFE